MTNTKQREECVFCQKIKEGSVNNVSRHVVFFEPLNPVTKGHLLVVPRFHVEDFTQDEVLSAEVMRIASKLAYKMKDVNLITSKGKYATQTIKHLHIHLVPRKKDDGLSLPWTVSQARKEVVGEMLEILEKENKRFMDKRKKLMGKDNYAAGVVVGRLSELVNIKMYLDSLKKSWAKG